MSPSLALLYTTFPSDQDVPEILKKLLSKHLIACANVLGPITSFYTWEGEPQESKEIAVLLKTSPSKVSQAIEALAALHPYEIPAILEIPVGKSLPSFSRWIEESVKE